MNYSNQILDDGNFPEVKIQIYKFNIMEYSVHCVLLDNQVDIMREFFEEISMGKVLWEDAKQKTLIRLHKAEYPHLSEKEIEKIYKINPNLFIRSSNVFQDLESSAGIQSIIREIKINQITD